MNLTPKAAKDRQCRLGIMIGFTMYRNALKNLPQSTVGFKGARRATYYAAQVAAEDVGRRARQDFGIKTMDINLKGLGQGRTACPKGLANVGLEITSIQDLTPKPHNGCRRRKPRRL